MFKKTLTSILILFLTVTFIGIYPVMASPSEQIIETTILDGEKIENAALLIADDGTTYGVDIFIQEQATTLYNNSGQMQQNIILDLSAENMHLLAAGSKTETGWDSSGGVMCSLTINYDRKSNGAVLLQSFSGYWVNHDTGGTAISGVTVYAGCQGEGENTGSAVNQWKQFNFNNSSFSGSTGFSTYVFDWSGVSSCGATAHVSIHRINSGSSWTLILENSLF